MICKFACTKPTFKNGNIKSIKKTNIAYVMPHIIKVNNIDYLMFDKCDDIFVNGYDKKIKYKDFMNTSKRVIKDMPNNQALFKELEDYTKNYHEIERQKHNVEVEVRKLEHKNEELRNENRKLHNFLNVMLQTLKKFFNKLLHIGTEKDKNDVVKEITAYHSLDYYNDRDLYDIADCTPRGEEINDYIYEQNYGYDNDYDDIDIDI